MRVGWLYNAGLMEVKELLHVLVVAMRHPVLMGALSGFLSAAVTDYHAFLSWKSFADVRGYDWDVAAFRWLQGTVVGAITGLGTFLTLGR